MAFSRLASVFVLGELLFACFQPNYDHPRCGPNGECPLGLTCNQLSVCEAAFAPSDAGGTSDSIPDDGQISGPPPDCLARWLDGTVTFSAPQILVNQSTPTGNERSPWVSNDGLRLYYSNDSVSFGEIFWASRPSTTSPFGTGVLLRNFGGARATLTADETLLVVSSDQVVTGQFDIGLYTRSSLNAAFVSVDAGQLMNVNSPGVQHYDPFLSADGLELYWAPSTDTQKQDIVFAKRASITSNFAVPTSVSVINDSAYADAAPAVTPDERIIVFSSTRPGAAAAPGGIHLWYATRVDRMHDFGVPKPIPTVNRDGLDNDPMLSSDGCELYFASDRVYGGYDLFVADVAR